MKNSVIGLSSSLVLFALVGCGGKAGQDVPQGSSNPPQGQVVQAAPAEGSLAPKGTDLTLKLSAPVDPSSFGASSFVVKDGSGNPVNGTAYLEGDLAYFLPENLLEGGRTYTFGLAKDVRDASGKPFTPLATTFLASSTSTQTEEPDSSASAPVVPGVSDLFLQGRFVELGISGNGYFGTDASAPAGYHPTRRKRRLSIVTDYGRDGWGAGSPPQSGDIFLPGSPEQGFTIQFNEGRYTNNGNRPRNNISPSSLVDASTSSLLSAVWTGSVAGMKVQRTVSLHPTDMVVKVDMVLTNTSNGSMNGVWFLENGDPDTGADIFGDYTTWNYVAAQPGYNGNPSQAWVFCYPDANEGSAPRPDISMGLGTSDARARAFHGGFRNRNPVYIWNFNMAPDPNAKAYQDEAIALSFNLGNLAPGASVRFTFYYVFLPRMPGGF